MTECDNIVIVIDIVSTKKTNTIVAKKTSVMSTASVNYHSKKVKDCYIFHTDLLAVILQLMITIMCDHYAKQKGII